MKALETETDASDNCAQMPQILGANIYPHSESALLAEDVPSIGSNAIFTTRDGEQVAVIGITIARKTM